MKKQKVNKILFAHSAGPQYGKGKGSYDPSIKDIPAIFLYHSKSDPEVPFEHLEFFKEAFDTAIVRELQGKEHIFSKGLPQLVSDIKHMKKLKN